MDTWEPARGGIPGLKAPLCARVCIRVLMFAETPEDSSSRRTFGEGRRWKQFKKKNFLKIALRFWNQLATSNERIPDNPN